MPSFWRPIASALVLVTIAAVILRITDSDANPKYGSMVWSVVLSGLGCAVLLTVLTDVRSRRTAGSIVCAVVGIAFGLWSLGNGPTWDTQQAMPATFDAATLSAAQKIDRTPAISGIAAPGDCVALSSTEGNSPRATTTGCADSAAGYRVIAVVDQPEQCPKDIDQRYFSANETGAAALCLDYNWTSSKCLKIDAGGATAAPCDTQGAQRPSAVITDATTTTMCPNGGYTHTARRYTVCTDLQTAAPKP
ncbi:hypothetical protein [Nocardia sp. NPDC049149]|uniref:LppU/SCO3897 family protein n=1 Tax=Nocardia sp. NPDC049149 TaxID=3364315 RepID=UPI003712E386